MNFTDWAILIHPAIAIIFVFPLLGIVLNYAWQTRQRRLQGLREEKSKITPTVGQFHVSMGKWLASAVVGVLLLGLADGIGKNIFSNRIWETNTFQFFFIVLMFAFTLASLVVLYRAREKHWRGIFATLTGMGIVVLGLQEGVFRRLDEWYWSHYLLGTIVALLMVFSLAIIEDIYQDRSQRWRYIHIILNCLALLLFIGQGITGTRDLLEISPSWQTSWQKTYIYRCDWNNKTCPQKLSQTTPINNEVRS